MNNMQFFQPNELADEKSLSKGLLYNPRRLTEKQVRELCEKLPTRLSIKSVVNSFECFDELPGQCQASINDCIRSGGLDFIEPTSRVMLSINDNCRGWKNLRS